MNKIEFLKNQIIDINKRIDQLKNMDSNTVSSQVAFLMKILELREKIFDIESRVPFKDNKTLQDAFDNFNNLYKIETGNNYEI